MSISRTAKKPVTQDWHPADVVCALHKAGWTLRRLSAHHGYSPTYLRRAQVAHQTINGQQLIADALGIEPQQIWPSRYDANGAPIPAPKGRKPRAQAKSSGSLKACNVNVVVAN